MSTPGVPFAKIAEVALTIIARASTPVTDESLLYAQGARMLLRGIANGSLVVSVAKPINPVAEANQDQSLEAQATC